MKFDPRGEAMTRKFDYEGALGLAAQEAGYAASDIVLIDDRSEAKEAEWWDGRSLFRVIEEMAGARPTDGGRAADDVRLRKVRISIEVLD